MKAWCALALGMVTLIVGCNGGSSPTTPETTTTTSTTTTTVPPSAQLVVQKRAIDVLENTLNTILVNTDFFYYIEVSNQGTADAVGVQIIDVIPETLDIGFLEFTEQSGYDRGMYLGPTRSREYLRSDRGRQIDDGGGKAGERGRRQSRGYQCDFCRERAIVLYCSRCSRVNLHKLQRDSASHVVNGC